MLTPFDEYPIHQTPLPVAQQGAGHSDHYDRYWFNGFTEDHYFAVALGLYPNRGVIDAAFSVVHKGVQSSVFASGRIPLDQRRIRIGPISIEITEPFLINTVTVDAADFGLIAELVFTARTVALEEPRQSLYSGPRLGMDVTRATQFGTWKGHFTHHGEHVDVGETTTYGVKDRSWGIRSVGEPAPMAPSTRPLQAFFLWAPLHFDDAVLHGLVFEDDRGRPWSRAAAQLDILEAGQSTWGEPHSVEHLRSWRHQVRWAEGLRRSEGASLEFERASGDMIHVELEPLITFRMRGAGYSHPTWRHGMWHGDFVVGGETHRVEELDSLDPTCIHVQQVVRATWGDRIGLGSLEQLVFGPHAPSGFADLLDGAPPRRTG